jgi:hypothetical protein
MVVLSLFFNHYPLVAGSAIRPVTHSAFTVYGPIA